MSVAIAPEEARRIKELITQFLYATYGSWVVSKVEIDSINKQEKQIEVSGKFDTGSIFEEKWSYFTIKLDAQYRLISYQRT